MNIGDAGLRLIGEFEGLSTKLYNDPAGHCTIGYGRLLHLGPCDGRSSEAPYANGISATQAQSLLREDVVRYERYVGQYVHVPLSQNQFDALVSFCYNIGGGGLEQSSVLNVLNQGRYDAVCVELRRYVYGVGMSTPLPGLIRRREAECVLFGTPHEEDDDMAALATMREAGAFLFIASDIGQGFEPNQMVCTELLGIVGDGATSPVTTMQHGHNLCLYAASETLRGNPLSPAALQQVRYLLKNRPQLA